MANAFIEDKMKKSYLNLFNSLKDRSLKPTKIKIDYEAAVIEALKEVFPEAVVSGYSYHFKQCLWRHIQQLVMVREYRNDPEVRLICRM